MNGQRWREWSGAEMTWMLYQQHVDALPAAGKRQFLHAAEDWRGLREFDNAKMKETNLSTGTV